MVIIADRFKLRDKRLSDARNDYLWQTDPGLAELDAVPLLTVSSQQYLLDYPEELRRNSSRARRSYAIETPAGEHIGNCVYYNIDEARGEAEVGIMIGNRAYWDQGYGTEVITCLVSHIFQKTNLRRLYLKTLDWNKRAQRCFAKCAFTPCGRMRRDGYNFVLMELKREQWAEKEGENRHAGRI